MNTQEELRKLKVFVINNTIRQRREMSKLLAEKKKERTSEDLLTVEEVIETYNMSRKTFDRHRERGLPVIQRVRNGKILVKRSAIDNYLKGRKW